MVLRGGSVCQKLESSTPFCFSPHAISAGARSGPSAVDSLRQKVTPKPACGWLPCVEVGWWVSRGMTFFRLLALARARPRAPWCASAARRALNQRWKSPGRVRSAPGTPARSSSCPSRSPATHLTTKKCRWVSCWRRAACQQAPAGWCSRLSQLPLTLRTPDADADKCEKALLRYGPQPCVGSRRQFGGETSVVSSAREGGVGGEDACGMRLMLGFQQGSPMQLRSHEGRPDGKSHQLLGTPGAATRVPSRRVLYGLGWRYNVEDRSIPQHRRRQRGRVYPCMLCGSKIIYFRTVVSNHCPGMPDL